MNRCSLNHLGLAKVIVVSAALLLRSNSGGAEQTLSVFCAACSVVSVPADSESRGQLSGLRRVAEEVPIENDKTLGAEQKENRTFGDVFLIAPPFEKSQKVGMGFYIKDGGACYVLTNAHLLQKGTKNDFFRSGVTASLTVGENEKPWPLEVVDMAADFADPTSPQEMRDFALLFDSLCRGNVLGKYIMSSLTAGMLVNDAGGARRIHERKISSFPLYK